MKNNKFTLFCFIIYKIALDMLFCYGTSVQYAYLNRILEFNAIKYWAGWIIYIILVLLIISIKNDDIKFMIKSIFILSGVSNISIFGLRNYNTKYFIFVLIFWIILIGLCIFYSNIKRKKEGEKEKTVFLSGNHLNSFLLVMGIIITIYLVKKFGLNVSSFTSLYQAREKFRTIQLSTIDSYLLSWNATVIFPWLFLISLNTKKYIRCILILVFALMMFAINGMKTWLVLYAIIIALVFITKKHDLNKSMNIITLGLTSLIIISLFAFKIDGQYNMLGMLDRSIILPGEINYYYLDFFSKHEFLYLRESIFKVFATSPYIPKSSVQISMINMSNAYYHNATNGLIGDYYGNFGIFGIIIYPFMIIATYIVLIKSTKGYDIAVKSVIFFILMWLLINTSFFTWLMTGGYLLYLLVLYLNKKIYIKLKK